MKKLLTVLLLSFGTVCYGGEAAVADAVRANEPDRTNSTESMEQYTRVAPHKIFDREQFLKEQIDRLIDEFNESHENTIFFKNCYFFWTFLAGASSMSSILVSSMGASGYIDSKLANVLTIAISLASAICIWLAQQMNKISNKYGERSISLQEALGVPSRLKIQPLQLELDQFKREN